MTINNTRQQKLPTRPAAQKVVASAFSRGVSIEKVSALFAKQLLFTAFFAFGIATLPVPSEAMTDCEAHAFFDLDALRRNAADGMSVHRSASLDVNISKVFEDVSRGADGTFPSSLTDGAELVGAIQFLGSSPKVHVRYRLAGRGDSVRLSLVGIEVRNQLGEIVLKSDSPVDPKTGELHPDVETHYAVRAVRRRLFLNYDTEVTRFIVDNAHWLSLATRRDLQRVSRDFFGGRSGVAMLSQIVRYRELQKKLATPQGQMLVRVLKLTGAVAAIAFLSSFGPNSHALVVDGVPGIWVHDSSNEKIVFVETSATTVPAGRSQVVHEVPRASDEFRTVIQAINEISFKKSHPRGVEL